MLALEDDVEAHALHRRGWSVAAIARHLGRSRTTIRAYLAGTRVPGQRRSAVPDPFAPFAPYVTARLRDDPHVWGTALYDEVRTLGFPLSYPRFTAALRTRGLRPACPAGVGVRGQPTIEIPHPPGVEVQWDYLELPSPWGPEPLHLLIGTLSHSGRFRGVFCPSEDQAHLLEGIDAVLRRLGGTARRWRFDRMAAVVSRAGRTLPPVLAAAKYYGVEGIDLCPPRRGNRKGVTEKRNHFATQRWWRTAVVTDVADAQRSFDQFGATIADALPRGDTTVRAAAAREDLQPLPVAPFPVTVTETRHVTRQALVAFRGNQYRVSPGLIGHPVQLRTRLGSATLEILTATGTVVATHPLAVPGTGTIVSTPAQRTALEHVVLAGFTTDRPCNRKANRPPGPAAQAAAAALRTRAVDAVAAVLVDLDDYTRLLEPPR